MNTFYLFLGFLCFLPAFADEFAVKGDDIFYEKDAGENRWTLYARNPSHGPKTVRLEFTRMDNVQTSKAVPLTLTIPAGAEKLEVLRVSPADVTQSSRFDYDWEVSPGDHATARHAADTLYLFPYEHGVKHLVVQGANGTFSHNVPGSLNAIDFSMEEGEVICAAREGLVIDVKEDSVVGGPDRARFYNQSNYVRILHEDGSLAMYAHLKYNSVLVEPGARVVAGQKIALSGNTGFSKGPHLDFKVMLPQADGSAKTVPIRFRGVGGKPETVREGWFYYSDHPGKPPFKEVLGRSITNATYARHHARVQAIPRTVEVREEQIDNTVVIFARNHNPQATASVTLSFPEIKNVNASKALPLTMRVPPLSERFLVFLRVADPTESWSHRYEFKWQTTR